MWAVPLRREVKILYRANFHLNVLLTQMRWNYSLVVRVRGTFQSYEIAWFPLNDYQIVLVLFLMWTVHLMREMKI